MADLKPMYRAVSKEAAETALEFRKLTKTKGAFPNENSLLKLLYLGLMNAQDKWTMPVLSWNLTLSQLAIYFEGRLNKVMTL